MQLFCRLVPPPMLTAHPKKKKVTFSKKWRGCRHANCVSALCVTCVTPPLKNPSYAPLTLDAKFTICCISLLLTWRSNGLIYFNLKLTFADTWKTAMSFKME